MENSKLDELTQAIEDYITAVKVYGSNTDAIETLKKTFKSNNITIQDWNTIVQIINDIGDIESLSLENNFNIFNNLKDILEEVTTSLESKASKVEVAQALLEAIAPKLDIVNGIVVKNTISALGNLSDYNVGQVFYIRNDGKIYQLNSSYGLDLVFDFKYIDAGRVDSMEIIHVVNAYYNSIDIRLLDKNNNVITSASTLFTPATTTKAGLMPAKDKATLDNIPNVYETKNAAQNSHDSLHNEIVAETTRATGVEAQKESLGNKQTVVNDSTATDANYLSAKAVRDFVNSSITSGASFFRGNFDYLENVPSGKTGTTLLGIEWQTTDPDAPHFVSNNDYALVNDDETHYDEAWRYKYVLGTGWLAEYKVNEAPFTQAQLYAINSGITATKVGLYDEHISDTDIHVTTEDKTKWDDVVNKQNKVIYSETEPENPQENDVWVSDTLELEGNTVIGNGLKVTESGSTKTLSVDIDNIRIRTLDSLFVDVNFNKTFAQIRDEVKAASAISLMFSEVWLYDISNGTKTNIVNAIKNGDYDTYNPYVANTLFNNETSDTIMVGPDNIIINSLTPSGSSSDTISYEIYPIKVLKRHSLIVTGIRASERYCSSVGITSSIFKRFDTPKRDMYRHEIYLHGNSQIVVGTQYKNCEITIRCELYNYSEEEITTLAGLRAALGSAAVGISQERASTLANGTVYYLSSDLNYVDFQAIFVRSEPLTQSVIVGYLSKSLIGQPTIAETDSITNVTVVDYVNAIV